MLTSMISQEFMITFAAYVAIIALLSAAAFQNFDKITIHAKAAIEKRGNQLQCIEKVFLISAGENAQFNAFNNTCSFYGGIFTGEKNAA